MRPQLIDVVAGRSATRALEWLDVQPEAWKQRIRYGVLDLSGPYRKVFTDGLGHVTQVADPFHVVKLANSKLDECRRPDRDPRPPRPRRRPAPPRPTAAHEGT